MAQFSNVKASTTQMIFSYTLRAEVGNIVTNTKLYKNIVDALQYVTIIRPNIAFYVNKVCQYINQPKAHIG